MNQMSKTEADLRTVMEPRAIRALNATWDMIGGDCLDAAATEQGLKGRAKERVTVTRDEVIDMVTSCGFATGYPMDYGNDREAVRWLEKQPAEEQDRICREAFPFERYGY